MPKKYLCCFISILLENCQNMWVWRGFPHTIRRYFQKYRKSQYFMVQVFLAFSGSALFGRCQMKCKNVGAWFVGLVCAVNIVWHNTLKHTQRRKPSHGNKTPLPPQTSLKPVSAGYSTVFVQQAHAPPAPAAPAPPAPAPAPPAGGFSCLSGSNMTEPHTISWKILKFSFALS